MTQPNQAAGNAPEASHIYHLLHENDPLASANDFALLAFPLFPVARLSKTPIIVFEGSVRRT